MAKIIGMITKQVLADEPSVVTPRRQWVRCHIKGTDFDDKIIVIAQEPQQAQSILNRIIADSNETKGQ